MLLQLLPFLIVIPAAIIMLADNAFQLAVVVTVSIGLVSVVATFAGGHLAALGAVIAIGGGYLSDWPLVMKVAAAAFWLGVLIAFTRDRSPQPLPWIRRVRRSLTNRGASPAFFIRVFAIYPWLLSCVVFERYSIQNCFSPSDPRPGCALTFTEFALWVCPIVLFFWELFTLDHDESALD